MILTAIKVVILFERLVERALASETFLLISRPDHVGNVLTVEFIVRRLSCSRHAHSNINESTAYQAEGVEIAKMRGLTHQPSSGVTRRFPPQLGILKRAIAHLVI